MEKILIICDKNWQILFATFDLCVAIKNKNTQNEIHYLTHESNRELIDQSAFCSKILYIKKDFVQNVYELLKENYSYIVNTSSSINSFVTQKYLQHKYNSSVKVIRYAKKEKKIAWDQKKLSQELCRKSAAIVAPFSNHFYQYKLLEEHLLQKDDLPLSHLGGFCTIVLSKALSTEKLEAVLKNELLPIIFIGDTQWQDWAQKICNTNSIKYYNAIGKFTIYEIQEIFCRSKKNYTSNCSWSVLATRSGSNCIEI